MAHDGSTNTVTATNTDDATCGNLVSTSKCSTVFGAIYHLDACVVWLRAVLPPGNCKFALGRVPRLSTAIEDDVADSKLAERRLEPGKRTSPSTHASSMPLNSLAV